MKLLVTTIIFTFISFGAFGVSIGEIYKSCKPYQINSFKSDGLSNEDAINSISCNAIFRTLINSGLKNCQLINNLRDHDKDMKTNTLIILKTFTANSNANLDVVITNFIKFAENNPNKWSDQPMWSHHEFLGNKFPCILTNP